jgi:pentatricopeptide repeat protein
MWCTTCHRGRPRPTTLDEELAEQYRKNGLEAALDYYADLKQKYYGRGPYDFGEDALNNFGYEVMKKDPAGAVQVLRLNAEQFPQSGNVWDSLAEAYMKSGNLKEAEQYYQKALARDASDQNAKDMLAKLQESKKD